MGFWGSFGRVPKRETHFLGFPVIGGSLGEQVAHHGELCRTTHVVLCVPAFRGSDIPECSLCDVLMN